MGSQFRAQLEYRCHRTPPMKDFNEVFAVARFEALLKSWKIEGGLSFAVHIPIPQSRNCGYDALGREGKLPPAPGRFGAWPYD
jgi:hypothetical protein